MTIYIIVAVAIAILGSLMYMNQTCTGLWKLEVSKIPCNFLNFSLISDSGRPNSDHDDYTKCVYVGFTGMIEKWKERKIERHSFIPKEGYVPNSETAEKIAEAVWLAIYGQEVLNRRPYKSKLEGEVWIVKGTLEPIRPGGVPEIEIHKKTGKILRVSHGK